MPTNHSRPVQRKPKPRRRPATNGWLPDLAWLRNTAVDLGGRLSIAPAFGPVIWPVLVAGEWLREELERQGARVTHELVAQASRAAERLAGPLGIASGNGVKELRQRLGRVERKVERFARERQDRVADAPAADVGAVPPPLPPWPAD